MCVWRELQIVFKWNQRMIFTYEAYTNGVVNILIPDTYDNICCDGFACCISLDKLV